MVLSCSRALLGPLNMEMGWAFCHTTSDESQRATEPKLDRRHIVALGSISYLMEQNVAETKNESALQGAQMVLYSALQSVLK